MRKILSLVLGLLWALPAFAALPSGYTQLEYIESTGTQYIDTGIYLASNMVVVVKAEQTGTSGNNIFGYTQGDSGRWMLSLNATTSTATLYSDKTNVVGSFSSMPVEITCNMGTGITVNGITTNFTESATRTAPATAWLFKAQGSSATPSGRIYYFKIYQNNNLIMNLVPAKNSSDVLGLYDFVSGQFFTNSGEGEFIAGPVVEIKIATTKYNETAFGPLNTALANAISVVDTVVSNTITQAGRIATLQAQKQTRPADDPSDANNAENCPAGKKCLLVEDASGVPHWYEIVENAYGLPSGYTALEYIQSDGASYLIVPYRVNNKTVFYCRYNEIQNGPQTANAVFGVTTSPDVSKANNGILRLTGSNFNRMGWGDSVSGSVIDVTAPKAFNTWYEVLYEQNKLYQNDRLYATSATQTNVSWVAENDLGIFARNSESVTMPAIAKISSVWAKENGEYKINLIPVKRDSDNVVGMYDTVSGEFFTNKGSGSFIAGDPVSE